MILTLGNLLSGAIGVSRLRDGRFTTLIWHVYPGQHFTTRPYSIIQSRGELLTIG